MRELVLILALCAAPAPAQQTEPATPEPALPPAATRQTAANARVLKADTEVKLVFAQTLSSKHATMGEKVELRVAQDVRSEGLLLVPKGTRVIGTVVKGKKNEKYGNSKDLAVEVNYILHSGTRIKLSGTQTQKAKTGKGAATATAIAFGLGGLLIYLEHREAWIREGTEVTAFIAEDVELPPHPEG